MVRDKDWARKLLSLSEVVCYRCHKPLGIERTIMYDETTKDGKGWRHGECDALPDMRPDGE